MAPNGPSQLINSTAFLAPTPSASALAVGERAGGHSAHHPLDLGAGGGEAGLQLLKPHVLSTEILPFKAGQKMLDLFLLKTNPVVKDSL